jgi:hypothetical protein
MHSHQSWIYVFILLLNLQKGSRQFIHQKNDISFEKIAYRSSFDRPNTPLVDQELEIYLGKTMITISDVLELSIFLLSH